MPIDGALLPWLAAIGVAIGLAILAGWRDRRRKRRAEPDAVGWIDWPSVQMLALIVAVALAMFALHDRV